MLDLLAAVVSWLKTGCWCRLWNVPSTWFIRGRSDMHSVSILILNMDHFIDIMYRAATLHQ